MNWRSWQGRAAENTTWEELDTFKADYPKFQLEDEPFHQEGGKCCRCLAFFGKQYVSRRVKGMALGGSQSG